MGPDDRLLSTPPDSQTRPTVTDVPKHEVIDVDNDTEIHPHSVVTPPRVPTPRAIPASPSDERPNDVFAQRPPLSPMPSHSPRRPRPPARISRPQRHRAATGDPSEDELSMSFSHEEDVLFKPVERAQAPIRERKQPQPPAPPRGHSNQRETSTTSSTRSKPSGSNRTGRRLTLDEEIRDAHARDDDYSDLEHGVLIGVGLKSKRSGFLAHGGAGGIPVHMGVGYVEGAEEDVDVEYQLVRKKTVSSGKRKGKR